MKIGIDIRCLMEKQYSGISEYTYNLLDNLFKIDQKNQYFLFYNAKKLSSIPKFNYSNVKFKSYNFPNKLFNLALRYLKIIEIDKLIGGVDVFLIPNFLFLNLSKKCKKILIVHDLSFELFPEFFTFKAKLWHKLINAKKMCHDANTIVTISENTKKDIINLYDINPGKIFVDYPGISNIFFKNISDKDIIDVKNKYKLPKKYIFYLGNLEPRKNVRTLLKSYESIDDPEIELVIAGGKAWKYQDIYKQVQNSSKKEKIHFLGYVDNNEKPVLYSLANIFVYPSFYEGFGLPPVEAMSCSCPVITSNNSSLVEVVKDNAITINPHNTNDLTQAINLLLSDENLYNRLKENGRSCIGEFNWKNSASRILEIIQKQ